MKTFTKIILTPVVALALGNCGGTVVGPTAASGSVASVAEATAAKTGFDALIANLAPTNLQSPGNLANVPGVTTSAVSIKAADPFDACTTINPTNVVDADGDGIAASKTYTYNCYGIVIPNHDPEDRVGFVRMTDDDDVTAGDGGGYSFEYDLTFSSARYNSTWMGEYSLTRPNNNLIFYSRFKGAFSEVNNGQTESADYESNYTYTMIPTDPTMPWTAGTSRFEGFFSIDYQSDSHDPPIDIDYTWEIDGEVQFENTGTSGCTQYYKDGYIQFRDEGNNVIRYDYTCTTVTYSFNGTTITN